MPYKSNADINARVRHVLPSGAQTIFRKAFNSAFHSYGEARAFAIAWSAVKKTYRKGASGKWVKK